MAKKYRIAFSPNGLDPFIYPETPNELPLERFRSFEMAAEYADVLTSFDLGRELKFETNDPQERMIERYKAYRRQNGINATDLIEFSVCTIDVWSEEDQVWYICSEDLEEEDPEPYMEAWAPQN